MAQLHLDVLSFGEIGGVGEMSYRTIRFPKYQIRNERGSMLLCPVYERTDALIDSKKDFYMTGQELLFRICNLYRKINDAACNASYVQLIAQWCTENTHPYQIDMIYEVLKDPAYDYDSFSPTVMRDGIFAVNDFLRDAEHLYNTVCFYQALKELQIGNDSFARALYTEGRFSDGLPFFEKYKSAITPADEQETDKDAPCDLLEEMQRDNERFRIKVDNRMPYEERLFLRNPLDDMQYLQEMLLGLFPEFKMKLRQDAKTKRIVFGADVQSVFDLGWYTLSRCVADDAPKEDDDPDSMFREGSILSCIICGDFFVRRGPRQLYCNKPDCQAARKRKNQRDVYNRQKAKKSPKGD